MKKSSAHKKKQKPLALVSIRREVFFVPHIAAGLDAVSDITGIPQNELINQALSVFLEVRKSSQGGC